MCPFRSLRLHIAFAGLLALACFIGGVVAGNLFHLAACPLCILQRMLYLLGAVFALGSAAGWARPWPARSLNAGFCITTATGAWVAAYQSYLQHNPAAAGCTADAPWWEDLVYWAGDQLPTFFLSSGMCSDPGFKLLGLSIAEYSLLAFVALFLLGAYSLIRGKH